MLDGYTWKQEMFDNDTPHIVSFTTKITNLRFQEGAILSFTNGISWLLQWQIRSLKNELWFLL